MAAAPVAETRLGADEVLALARPNASGELITLSWPTGPDGRWKVSFAREGGPAEVGIDDRTGNVTPPRPPQPETTARLMRRIHDGTGMGALWQIIIFIGGIIPAMLAITGIIMWWKARRRRTSMIERRALRTV